MDPHFSTRMPFRHFARNTLAVSTLALVPVLGLYVALSPGFAASLAGGGPALSRFLRQVLTNGLPVVFAVNYLSFFLYAAVTERGGGFASPLRVILLDIVARAVLFVGLHAVIYVGSAGWFGSFGGDRLEALRVLGPTLMRSAAFGNISGAYLYATMVSALPLYLAALGQIRSRGAQPFARIVPRLAVALALCAVSALLVTALAALAAQLR